MESNGVGWDDDDDPPGASRLSRLPQPATKRIAAATVVVLVAGGGFWAAHRASHSGPQVGDCAIDSTTDIDRPAIRKAACRGGRAAGDRLRHGPGCGSVQNHRDPDGHHRPECVSEGRRAVQLFDAA